MNGTDVRMMLAGKARRISLSASELVAFADREPGLAGGAAVEVLALEARGILSGGSVSRALSGNAVPGDLASLDRLEQLVSTADERLAGAEARMAESESGAGVERLGALIGLASGAVGLIKTFV